MKRRARASPGRSPSGCVSTRWSARLSCSRYGASRTKRRATFSTACAKAGRSSSTGSWRAARSRRSADAQNVEILLRWLRQAQRPASKRLPVDWLPLFLGDAAGPGAARRRARAAAGKPREAFRLPAAGRRCGKARCLPARLAPYYPSWLDSLMQESELLWVGCGKEKLTFGFPSDLELFFGATGEARRGGGGGRGAPGRAFPGRRQRPRRVRPSCSSWPTRCAGRCSR